MKKELYLEIISRTKLTPSHDLWVQRSRSHSQDQQISCCTSTVNMLYDVLFCWQNYKCNADSYWGHCQEMILLDWDQFSRASHWVYYCRPTASHPVSSVFTGGQKSISNTPLPHHSMSNCLTLLLFGNVSWHQNSRYPLYCMRYKIRYQKHCNLMTTCWMCPVLWRFYSVILLFWLFEQQKNLPFYMWH